MADVQMRRDRTPARNVNESTNTLDRMPLSSERMLRMDQGCSSTAKNTSLSTLPKQPEAAIYILLYQPDPLSISYPRRRLPKRSSIPLRNVKRRPRT
jgi:hypothetical protein